MRLKWWSLEPETSLFWLIQITETSLNVLENRTECTIWYGSLNIHATSKWEQLSYR